MESVHNRPCNPILCWCEEPSLFSLNPLGLSWNRVAKGFESSGGRGRQRMNTLEKTSDKQPLGIAPVPPPQIASHPCSAWFGKWTSNWASCTIQQIPALITKELPYWLWSSPDTLISSQDAFGSKRKQNLKLGKLKTKTQKNPHHVSCPILEDESMQLMGNRWTHVFFFDLHVSVPFLCFCFFSKWGWGHSDCWAWVLCCFLGFFFNVYTANTTWKHLVWHYSHSRNAKFSLVHLNCRL